MRYRRLFRLRSDERLEFVVQRLVLISKMRERGAQNGRHVMPSEAVDRAVDWVKQLLI